MNNDELKKGSSVFFIELEKIEVNPYQPRIEFNQEKLEALADSIKQYGILQPIVVSRKEEYSEEFGIRTKYQIIAGERRFRASKIAGLNSIPAIIREQEDTDAEKLELAIIENLQREDLNPVDKARAFKKLADDFGLKHVEIAKKMGKSREYVSNAMRILMLPEQMLIGLTAGKISEGHTRSLLMLKERLNEQAELYKRIINDKLTVRAAEKLAREIATDKIRKKIDIDPEIKSIENGIREKLGTKVSIDQKPIGDGGKLTIEYFNKEDLRKILAIIENDESGMNELKLNNLEQKEDENLEVENQEEKNNFEDIQPTVFKEEIEKIEQFGNIEPEEKIEEIKTDGFVGFSIGTDSVPKKVEIEKVEKDIIVEKIEIPEEKQIIVDNNLVSPQVENIVVKPEVFENADQNIQIPEIKEEIIEPVVKEKINNFSAGGLFKKFGFGKKTEDVVNNEDIKIEVENKIEENTISVETKIQKVEEKKQNELGTIPADLNSNLADDYGKNEVVINPEIDGLKKIEIKNDFDKTRVNAFAKTDEILGSFGEKKSQAQSEIDDLLSGINQKTLNKPVPEVQIQENIVVENTQPQQELIKENIEKEKTVNPEYSDLYAEFLKSREEIDKNKEENLKKDENIIVNQEEKTTLESVILEENGFNVKKADEQKEIQSEVKTEVISAGNGFLADANIAQEKKEGNNRDEVQDLEKTEDDKYRFKGFSL